MAEELKKRLTELAGRAAERGYYIYTDFLSPTGIAVAEGLRLPVPITAFGGAEFCERRIIRFGDFGYEEEFPLRIIKISPASERFFKAVTHRDYLGALMSLGIERDRMGDILIDGKTAYAVVAEALAEYVIINLTGVGGNTVRCEIVSSIPQSLEPKAEEITASVASLRLDAILCRVLNLPRDGGAQLIRDGYVFVSGRQEESASYVPKENEIITVRGYGKLCFCGIKGTSAKGRLQITVKKYK